MRVISGHLGWVRSVAVEPGNQWFCTGAADRVIKVVYMYQSGLECHENLFRFGTWQVEP
jgi:WD40 repeat protein